MEYKDYYKILGVDKNADAKEIKSAFRKLAKQYHPDLHPDDALAADRFKEVNEAYEVLGDEEKRKQYDMFGAQGNFSGGQNFNPRDFGFGGYTQSGDASGFSDFFDLIFGSSGGKKGGFSGFGDASSVFGNFGKKRSQPRGQYRLEMTITLEEAFKGVQRDLHVSLNGQNITLPVKVPAGILPGKSVKMNGEPYGIAGDIIIRIQIQTGTYEFNGVDLIQKVKVLPWEAWFGDKVTVQTLHGKIKVTVPKNTRTGARIRIANKGYTDMKGNQGDLFLEFVIDNPTTLTKEQEKVYETLKEM